MSVNLVFGHIFSILVLRLAIKNQWKKPINIMICIDEGIKMVGYTWNNVVLIASVNRSDGLMSLTGKPFCQLTYFEGAFGALSNVFCGTGIAMLRLLYIKHPMAVQRLELKIANLLLSGCVGLAFLGSYLHYISPKRNTTTDDICMGTPRDLELCSPL